MLHIEVVLHKQSSLPIYIHPRSCLTRAVHLSGRAAYLLCRSHYVRLCCRGKQLGAPTSGEMRQ